MSQKRREFEALNPGQKSLVLGRSPLPYRHAATRSRGIVSISRVPALVHVACT